MSNQLTALDAREITKNNKPKFIDRAFESIKTMASAGENWICLRMDKYFIDFDNDIPFLESLGYKVTITREFINVKW